MTTRVVIVRPWASGHVGGGCCSGDAAGVVDDSAGVAVRHDPTAERAAACYLALRDRLPDVDVQLVSPGNTWYLLPALYRSARGATGVLGSLRAAVGAPAAGTVVVDGERVGDVDEMGPEGLLAEIGARLAARG